MNLQMKTLSHDMTRKIKMSDVHRKSAREKRI